MTAIPSSGYSESSTATNATLGSLNYEAPPLPGVQPLRPTPLHPEPVEQEARVQGVGMGMHIMPKEINKRLCLHPVQTGVITAKGPRGRCLRCGASVRSAIATGRDTNIFDD